MTNAGPRCLRAPGMAVGVRLTLPADAVPRSALSRQVDGSEGCGRLHGTGVVVLHVESAPDVRSYRPGRSSRCLVAPVPSGRVCGQHQKCTARTRSHAASGWMRRLSIPAVALSGPEQPGAVCKDPRGSAYPTTRTGRKGAAGADLAAAARRREAGAGPLGVWVVKFSFSAIQNTIARTQGPRWRPSAAGGARRQEL